MTSVLKPGPEKRGREKREKGPGRTLCSILRRTGGEKKKPPSANCDSQRWGGGGHATPFYLLKEGKKKDLGPQLTPRVRCGFEERKTANFFSLFWMPGRGKKKKQLRALSVVSGPPPPKERGGTSRPA